jgi:hypothetical protein
MIRTDTRIEPDIETLAEAALARVAGGEGTGIDPHGGHGG